MTRLPRASRASVFSLAVFALTTIACASTGSRPSNNPPELEQYTVWHDFQERTYYILEPPGLTGPVPLVVSLHGGGGNGPQTCSMEGGIQELAEREGFVVACPEGVENHWNDGRKTDRYRAHREDIDDVGFLTAMIFEISEDYDIDLDHLYITGASNGGMMSLRMACEAGHLVTAVGAVIASLPADLRCDPTGPVSVLIMNGTEDPLVQYEGGQVRFLRQELGEVIHTREAFGTFVNRSKCSGPPEVVWLPDLDPNDGTITYRETFEDCLDGKAIYTIYTIEGGGHTMPGGAQYSPKYLIGRVSRDFSGAEAIWDFFERAPPSGQQYLP